MSAQRNPPRGRPVRAGSAATERIEIRVTKLERASLSHYAAADGVSISEWIRRRVFTEASPTSVFSCGATVATADRMFTCSRPRGHKGEHTP